MTSTFMAMVLLPEPLTLSFDQVAAVVGSFPAAADAVLGKHEAEQGRFAIRIGAQQFGIQAMADPIPEGSFAKALGGSDRDALSLLVRAHRAHLVVFCKLDQGDMGDAVMAAAGVHLLAARLGALATATAGFWVASERLAPWAEFTQYAEAMPAAYDAVGPVDFPTRYWVSADLAQDADTAGATTLGLKHFTGYELLLSPTAWPAPSVAARLVGTVEYLFANGTVLEDGQTLGATDEERFAITRETGSELMRLDLMEVV
ncbi:DUF4261 domain-containing protein [uncultured Sulfitobacter sp.]|uniref:DUF4261 domain-containing protein n=1 Tax=uncultured Sulfitobacter sp. TaxID=191468 RepID=UPI00260A4872|nr:DUF4261 domain-containing protein [uncultured Sulfitobacter sp.]